MLTYELINLLWYFSFSGIGFSIFSRAHLIIITLTLTTLWQAAALAFYILSALFVNSFVIVFVITVLLAALDFWVVKNVSGRILVGLRWWNEINEQGESVWKFECLDQEVFLLLISLLLLLWTWCAILLDHTPFLGLHILFSFTHFTRGFS